MGQGTAARTLTLDLPPFTLDRRDDAHGPAHVAAARPLRDDVPARLLRARRARAIVAARRGSSASRSPPRRPRRSPAARAARRASRTASSAACATSPQVRHEGAITTAIAREALDAARGRRGRARAARPRAAALDRREVRRRPGRRLTLAASLGEEPDTIEYVYEPYLLQLGFIPRTPRGRTITALGRAHVGAAPAAEVKLF